MCERENFYFEAQSLNKSFTLQTSLHFPISIHLSKRYPSYSLTTTISTQEALRFRTLVQKEAYMEAPNVKCSQVKKLLVETEVKFSELPPLSLASV